MPHESGTRGGERTPPETTDAVLLDAVAENGRAARALCLERCLESVYRGQDHAKRSRTEDGF